MATTTTQLINTKQFLENNEAPQKISKITFGLLSPQDMVRLSEMEVVSKDLYKHPERTPMKYGVLDLRLGTSDKTSTCETCGNKLIECIGHFGCIGLELPVYHVGYFKVIISILNMICKECCRILLPEEDRKKFLKDGRRPGDSQRRQVLLKRVSERCRKNLLCPRCGNQNGLVKKVGVLKLIHEKYRGSSAKREEMSRDFFEQFDDAIKFNPEIKQFLGKAQEDLTPITILRMFERIPPEDVELLYMDPKIGRPERLILTHILVPPVCIRPSVAMDAALGSNEDDLTMKLTEIIHVNTIIKNAIEKGATINVLMEDWDFLQLQCAMLINSELPLPPSIQPSKPIRGICQRLKGKAGRFRGNLSGKRVDFSGRTVISPDPNLRIDQVAVPEIVAKTLTYPERVTAHNIQKMRQLVLNGATIHPGANFLVHADGTKSFLRFGDRSRVAGELRIGDIVERHLADGDLVLFNRQPSLHRISIMCHKAKIMPWRTFRFNECVCTPYNADFDGDEMNLHVPQTEEARAEALTLMGVVHNLITPRTGEPIIAATQDFLTTSFLVSMKDTFYDRSQFAAICTYAFDANTHIDIPPPAILKPMNLWTGKQVFSVLIKPNNKSRIRINVEMKSKSYTNSMWMCPKDGYVCIQNSELLCGVMDKVSLGGGSKTNIFHIIMRDYSPDEAAECMTRLSKLSARWIGNRGFSIGISDVMPSLDLRREKEKLVDEGYIKCGDFIEQYKHGKLPPQPGCNAEQTLEAKLNGELSDIREQAGKLCLGKLHHLNSPLIMAVCGSKGSTINISQMIACVGQQTVSGNRIPNGFLNRSLPHFETGSKAPAAKGFVQHSFYDGLSPTEFFFHTMGGREGLVDTAVKTAETGYMQRRLMKALEDLSTQYDNTVRNSSGDIVQFVYGDDELDPSGMEAPGKPVDFNRIMLHVQSIHPAHDEQHLLPADIMQVLDAELGSSRFAECSDLFKEEIRAFFKNNATQLVERRKFLGFPTTMNSTYQSEAEYELKSPAAAKASLNLHRITASQVTLFLDTCLKKYRKATIEPGTAVGALAAQSIGEPGTQMTLKTFHFAGVASMNITLGVPRIKEIINAAKNISTPVITATLVSDSDLTAARIVKGRIEKTTIGEIAKYIKEVFRPAGSYLSVKLDKECIESLQLEVTIDTVRIAILSEKKLKLKDKCVVVVKDDKLRVYPLEGSPEQVHYSLQHLKTAIPNVVAKGIIGVERAVINEVKEGKYNLLVEGNELAKVMATPGIKGTHTTSNHVIEVQKCLGIEAARFTIMSEIQTTMKHHGMTIDTRHVMLLADVMSFRGEILGIQRFGISKMKDSVLMLASFEKTTDHLFDAAVHAREEHIEGVSECIIMGIPVPLGTGLFKVLHRPKNIQLHKRSLLLDSPSLSLNLPTITT